jgi:SapC
MAQLLFYERPVPLSTARHGGVRLAIQPDHMKVAAHTHVVPLTGTEFADAARDMPVVFGRSDTGHWSALALLGLRAEENLFVDAQGRWEAGAYVPAFVRRYPFVLAEGAPGQPQTVVVDEACNGLTRDPAKGEPLLDAQGQPSEFLKAVMQFLRQFHAEAERTQAFLQRLQALDLLVPKPVTATVAELPHQVDGLWRVEVTRYRALPDAEVLELFREGFLTWIEAHLASQGQVGRLGLRLSRRLQGA